MFPQYHLAVTRETVDKVIFEESPNYGNAFICLSIGVVFLTLAVIGIILGVEDASWRKFLSTSLLCGFCFCCISVTYFIRSTIVLDREQQSLAIRRRLLALGWAHHYAIGDIERIFEGTASEKDKRLLAIGLTNGRTKKLTLWAKRTSLSSEEAQLNSALKRFRDYGAGALGRNHKPVTEEEWWEHTKENASVDVRRGLKRTLWALIAVVVTAMAVVPFLAGHALHKYWKGMGTLLLLALMILWLLLILSASSTYIAWTYMRDLKKIDSHSGTSDE